MARPSWFQRLHVRYFSKPVSNRQLLLHVMEHPVTSILEIGMGNGERTRQLIRWAKHSQPEKLLRYAGVDPFESSAEGRAHLKLKQAHQMLSEMGIKAHLIPGDAASALSRVVSTVMPCDLLVLDGDYSCDSPSGKALQHYLPRLVADNTIVFATGHEGGNLERVEIERGSTSSRLAA